MASYVINGFNWELLQGARLNSAAVGNEQANPSREYKEQKQKDGVCISHYFLATLPTPAIQPASFQSALPPASGRRQASDSRQKNEQTRGEEITGGMGRNAEKCR